jgi:hypothetical protein
MHGLDAAIPIYWILKLDFGQTVEVPVGEVKYVSAQAGGFLLSPL